MKKKISEQTYTTKEVLEILDEYLFSSTNRLRIRLKNAGKKSN